MASTARENILNRITEALVTPVPLPFADNDGDQDFFVENTKPLPILFEGEFKKLQGQFYSCKNEEDLLSQLSHLIAEKNWQKIFVKDEEIQHLLNNISIKIYNDLPSCDVSITTCEALIARTGSMVLTTAQANGRTSSVYAPIHICIAYASQLLYDVKDALKNIKEKYAESFPSFITFASGPSRTADIEKTLVTGVHGPKEVYCFLVDG